MAILLTVYNIFSHIELENCYAKSSGHIRWHSSKIISRLVSVWCSLSADPNIADLLQREHPKILTGIGVGYRKNGFYYTKALISLKCGKKAMCF